MDTLILGANELGLYLAIFGVWFGLFQTGLPQMEAKMAQGKSIQERKIFHLKMNRVLAALATVSLVLMPLIVIFLILQISLTIAHHIVGSFVIHTAIQPIITLTVGLVFSITAMVLLSILAKNLWYAPIERPPKSDTEVLIDRLDKLIKIISRQYKE